MKISFTPFVVISLGTSLIAFDFLVAQETAPPPIAVGEYESLPELKASEILKPEFLSGPHHKVREEVPTYSGANRFTIDSDFGVFEAEGNEMLVRRINEINAIVRLKEISRTDQFKDALVKAAKSPVAAAKNIVKDPVGTLQSVPKGLKKFMSRAGETLKGIGKKSESDQYEGSQMQQIIGYSDTKRKVAISLGVDPYSSNDVLQHELEDIAWATFAGGATFSLATLPIGGGAGVALTTTGVQSTLEDILREKNPTDLKIMNRRSLVGMGASEREAERLLSNGAFSPTAQTAFVLNLKSLGGVANRRAFIRLAGENSAAESDAIFCVQTSALMSELHKGDKPLASITLIGDFPVCIARDGTVVIALQWDYAARTKVASDFAKAIQEKFKDKPARLIAISGMVSPQLRQELETDGYTVRDRIIPGPLK
jgi:hypothetical protein